MRVTARKGSFARLYQNQDLQDWMDFQDFAPPNPRFPHNRKPRQSEYRQAPAPLKTRAARILKIL